MAETENINQILKEIVVKTVQEYLDAPIPEDKKHLPKSNTKKNIAEKTGINITTLGRHLNPKEDGSCPDLIETMEILRVIGKREALFEFTKHSNCHAAKFIKELYPKYIEAHQIEADINLTDKAPLAGEVLKVINEHQVKIDKKLYHYGVLGIGALFLINVAFEMGVRSEIKDLRKDINSLIKEIESKTNK